MIAIDYDSALALSGVFGTLRELQKNIDDRKDPRVGWLLRKAEEAIAEAMRRLAPDPQYWDDLARRARRQRVQVVLVEDDGEEGAA